MTAHAPQTMVETAGPIFESLCKRFEYTVPCSCGAKFTADTKADARFQQEWHADWQGERDAALARREGA